jgi:hypothetical protein
MFEPSPKESGHIPARKLELRNLPRPGRRKMRRRAGRETGTAMRRVRVERGLAGEALRYRWKQKAQPAEHSCKKDEPGKE